MSIDDKKINEVLNIPTINNIKNLPEKKTAPPVPRLEDKNKMLTTITNIVEKIIIT